MGDVMFGVPMIIWYLATAIIVMMFSLGFMIYVVRGLPWKMGMAATRNKVLQLTSRANESFAALTPKYRNGMNMVGKNKIWLHQSDSVMRCGRVQIQLAPEHWGVTWNMGVLEVIDTLEREKIGGLHVRTYDDLLALDRMIERSEKSDKEIDWASNDEDIRRYREMVAGINSIQHLKPLVTDDESDGSPSLINTLSPDDKKRLKELIAETKGKTLDVSVLKKGDGEILYKAIMSPVRGSTIVVKRCMNFFRNNFEIDAPQQIAAHVDSEVALRKSDENSLMKLLIVGCVGIAIACIAGALAFMMITGAT